MSAELYELSIRIGRETRIRQQLDRKELMRGGDMIAREMPRLEQLGRVTVLVKEGNVFHIISRSRH